MLTIVSLLLELDNVNLEQIRVSDARKYIDTSEREHKLSSIVFESLRKLLVEQKVMIEDVEASNI